MTPSSRIIAEIAPGESMLPAVRELLEFERRTWPLFRENEATLAGIPSKRLTFGDAAVIVQSNPGRIRSIFAKTDPASVAERPCFLCERNLPPEERAVAYGEYLICPNPYPILVNHLTIPARDHVPQDLAGRSPALLDLARDLGPEMFVFYNGARCGASAPDHFHFQAASSLAIPLLHEIAQLAPDGATARESIGRRFLLFRHREIEACSAFIDRALAAMASMAPDPGEPLFNLAATVRSGDFLVLLFPRARHRPERFFARDHMRLSVSPATLEMMGCVVVGEPEHFALVDGPTVQAIYQEVCFSKNDFDRLVEKLT